MGKFDAESKKYLSINRIFADAFNFLIYDGEPVIKPEALHAVDTTEIAIPYGHGARVPIQKYRDIMKIWAAMQDEDAVYVLLGGEAQNKVHYAMPVRDMLYDSINYVSQVDEAKRSYRNHGEEGGELSFEAGELKIRLTQEEFLSGFRKGDKLIPVITAVIYFGPDEWDGPMSIHDMLKVSDERMLRVIPNYTINLIAPAGIDDEDFGKFNTDLGLAMKVIKYQRTSAVEIIQQTNHRKIDRGTAEFLNRVVNLNLVYQEPAEEGGVDMCKAMEDNNKKMEVLGAIKALRLSGNSPDQIIKLIVENYQVTKEYVENLMGPIPA